MPHTRDTLYIKSPLTYIYIYIYSKAPPFDPTCMSETHKGLDHRTELTTPRDKTRVCIIIVVTSLLLQCCMQML